MLFLLLPGSQVLDQQTQSQVLEALLEALRVPSAQVLDGRDAPTYVAPRLSLEQVVVVGVAPRARLFLPVPTLWQAVTSLLLPRRRAQQAHRSSPPQVPTLLRWTPSSSDADWCSMISSVSAVLAQYHFVNIHQIICN